MKYLKQFFIILSISFVGEILSYLIPLPIPASIYGIVILFVGLMTKLIPMEAVKDTGKFLIEIMPIMFIPAAVGLIESWEILSDSLPQYICLTAITTFLVMGVSGRITQSMIRRRKQDTKEKGRGAA
ncbi:MAG: CidA/LrgA family protein [Lachnospiraceae bacterium]|nr:CidA/LrgA family protein [Lachnospiraceae bacterium]